MIKNYIEVPVSQEEDINKDLTTWKDGKCISLDEGEYITVYIDHTSETISDEEGNERTVVKAYPIRVEKPLSRDKLINAAEQQAYGLVTAMEVASFNASLARKSRENEDSEEVKEHDEFISWVKDKLTEVGI